MTFTSSISSHHRFRRRSCQGQIDARVVQSAVTVFDHLLEQGADSLCRREVDMLCLSCGEGEMQVLHLVVSAAALLEVQRQPFIALLLQNFGAGKTALKQFTHYLE